jgi:conjugative transfer signal peptidase TraF
MSGIASSLITRDHLSMKRLLPLAIVAGVMGVALLGANVEPALIYNRSPSVPVGYYLRVDDAPARGAFVTIPALSVAPDYARQRGYGDATDRFIKRVAAVAGDQVCAHGDSVGVRGEITLRRQSSDRQGRSLPTWSGCRVLGHGELFLLGDTDDSFDARYWGPVHVSEIHGVWRRVGPSASHGLKQMSSTERLRPRRSEL